MNVIYLDVLIFTNFIICICFLLITKKLTHSYSSTILTVVGAITGSFSSVVIFINNGFIALIIKLTVLIIQIAICFKTISIKKIIINGIVYFIVNLCYFGFCIVIWNFFDKRIFYIKNMTVYFDLDTKMLILATVFVYSVMTIYEMLSSVRLDKLKNFKVEFTFSKEKFVYNGIADTGNSLIDYYYNKPVLIISSDSFYEKLKIFDNESLIDNKLHIIPCSTVSGEGLLYVTRPMEVIISSKNNSKSCDVCVGITRQHNNKEMCIFNPKILI